MSQSYYVYLLKCSDASYYAGLTDNLDLRIAQHQTGFDSKSYTYSRRPVKLVWTQVFPTHDEAFRCERQIKGWSRAKKEALIRGDWDGLREVILQQKKKRASLKKHL